MSNICGIRRMGKVRNPSIIKRCGCESIVLERIERNVLKWFGYVEKMDEKRLIKTVSGIYRG